MVNKYNFDESTDKRVTDSVKWDSGKDSEILYIPNSKS